MWAYRKNSEAPMCDIVSNGWVHWLTHNLLKWPTEFPLHELHEINRFPKVDISRYLTHQSFSFILRSLFINITKDPFPSHLKLYFKCFTAIRINKWRHCIPYFACRVCGDVGLGTYQHFFRFSVELNTYLEVWNNCDRSWTCSKK